MIEITGLQGPNDAREVAHAPGTAVDADAVDDAVVGDPPERARQHPRARCHDILVEPVEVVLVVQNPVQQSQTRAQHTRQVRPADVQEPRHQRTGRGQVQRHGMGRRMDDERGGAVELLAHLAHHVLLREHEDRVVEEPAEEHGPDGDPADDDRRHGQSDQRRCHHPGRLPEVLPGVVIDPLLAVKNDEQQPETVERGYKDSQQHAPIGVTCAGDGRVVHRLDERVLGEEPGEAREADQRQRSDQRRPVGDRHVLAQPAHLADVLLMVQRDDHRARGEEQQRLEEGVRHQVEDARGVGRGAQRHGHVAELGQRRVGHDALDVLLDHAQQPGEERRGGADHQHHAERGLRVLEQRRHPRHHEDAGSHHGGGVDEGGDGRGTFHGIRQPDVQRHLRRFAHGSDEQRDAGHREHRPLHPGEQRDALVREPLGGPEDRLVIQRAGECQQRRDPQQEAEVADAVDEERLHVGEDRGLALEPEADEQVRHHANGLPAEEQLQEVVRHHQREHGEGKERYVAEEALVAVVVGHVADGVDVHRQRHEAHHGDHQRGQVIDEETDLQAQPAHLAPLVDGAVVDLGAAQDIREHHQRQQE